MSKKGKKKLQIVGADGRIIEKPKTPLKMYSPLPIGTPFDKNRWASKIEARKAEALRRSRPIEMASVFKQGPYEIEMVTPITGHQSLTKFHCIAPYEHPLHIKADTKDGQLLAMGLAQAQMDVTVHDGMLFLAGGIEWNIADPVIGTIEGAFERLHDELPKRISDRVTAQLNILKKMFGPQIKLPTADDHRKFGG